MTKRSVSLSRLKKQRQGLMKKLRSLGPVVAASLVKVEHKTCDHTIHMLTFKDEGKTKSIYIPLDMVKEVEEWVKNNKRMKAYVRQISSVSVGMIRRYVTEKKDAVRRKKRLQT